MDIIAIPPIIVVIFVVVALTTILRDSIAAREAVLLLRVGGRGRKWRKEEESLNAELSSRDSQEQTMTGPRRIKPQNAQASKPSV